jgi:UDP-N-acetylmuramate dehydrogenase
VINREAVSLSELTTLRVGGPARRLIEAQTEEEVVEVVQTADADGEPLLVLGAGSNLLVADEGFPGTVLRVASRGMTIDSAESGDAARVSVAAGELWDEVVERAIADGLSGLECLSGIPGLTGATPIQNVGAYGQEVAQTITAVRVFDRETGVVKDLSPEQCGFGYRTSAFKRSSRHIVLAVNFRLERTPAAQPIGYPELARALEAEPGSRPRLAAVRETVIALRRTKGMVLDPADPDSVSAGSFFLNPMLTGAEFKALERRISERFPDTAVPGWPGQDGAIKVSAAWLIAGAGFERGYRRGGAAISSKHTLALVNRGGASAGEVVALARELRDTVRSTFGVTLVPEPTLVGVNM